MSTAPTGTPRTRRRGLRAAGQFMFVLLATELSVYLGVLTVFDHVTNAEGQITRWPARHMSWCDDLATVGMLNCRCAGEPARPGP